MTDQDAAAILDAFASELATKAEPLQLVLSPVSVMQLVSALQLARRHPQFADHATVADAADRFLRGARAYFADCPVVLDVIRRGDDPHEDET